MVSGGTIKVYFLLHKVGVLNSGAPHSLRLFAGGVGPFAGLVDVAVSFSCACSCCFALVVVAVCLSRACSCCCVLCCACSCCCVPLLCSFVLCKNRFAIT